jgi:hypothetical protein
MSDDVKRRWIVMGRNMSTSKRLYNVKSMTCTGMRIVRSGSQQYGTLVVAQLA